MCGISGIVSKNNISKSLTKSIKDLEYRGYDSCGMAIIAPNGEIKLKKNIGGVDEANKIERFETLEGAIGIAHTRWATHGEVTKENTHPHLSCDNNFAIVHNGIISNYYQLKKMLIEKGHKFLSKTDTEVIVHMIEYEYSKSPDVEQAFINTLKILEGTFAVVMVNKYEPSKILCGKFESPLVIGVGNGENFIGSDFNAFINFTKKAVILEDYEYAVVDNDKYVVKNFINGKPLEREITVITWDNEMTKKGGYPHYMLKEIYEQPSTVNNALKVDDKKIKDLAILIAEAERFYLTGVGTTYYISLFGQYQFASYANFFSPAISSDEFPNIASVDDKTVVLALSQSGETYDTLAALKYSKLNGAKIAAVVNVIGSSIARMTNQVILQGSGPEICVISTKAALAQAIIIIRLSLEVGLIKGVLSQAEKDKQVAELKLLPDIIQTILNEKSGFINSVAKKYCKIANWLYLGRGKYYPIALESALKMKEVAYVHAEGMPAGFLKHGTIALIDENLYSVIFVPPSNDEELFNKILGSAEEIKARKGFIFGLHFNDHESLKGQFNEEIVLPKCSSLIAPIVQMVVAQLFSYFTATSLKRNIDKPRSLAKSVTVG